MTQEPVRVGERLLAGRYALLSEVGRGGMGIVWLAEDRMIGRRVAIKELHLPGGVDPAEREIYEKRVLREARAAGRLNDPGVVTLHDVLRESGTTYIVMELIQAPTLSDLVQQRGPLPQEMVARIAEQLLSALETAHAAGVVHRDVKPSNIMVLPNGRVKLTDFGIAQSTDDPRLTTSGILVGSPVYMAPERLNGAVADPGSDLWALGAVLFFAVEGYAAFERASAAASMHAILNDVPFLRRSQGPLASVIMGLLNARPEARPSPEQVRGLLTQATATPPGGFTTAPYGGTRAVAAPPPSRKRRGLVAGLVAFLALALFAGGFLTRGAPAFDGRPDNMDETLTYGDGGYLRELSWDTSPAGGCLNGDLAEGRRFVDSAQVDCGEDHDLQFFFSRVSFPFPEDYDPFPEIDYPGIDGLTAYAEQLCTMAFDSTLVNVGDEEKEGLRYRAVVPAEDAWKDVRSVLCVLYQANGDQMTKSMVPLE